MSTNTQNAKDSPSDVKNDIKDALHDAANDVKDAAHDVKNQIKDAAHDVKNDVKDAAHDAQERHQGRWLTTRSTERRPRDSRSSAYGRPVHTSGGQVLHRWLNRYRCSFAPGLVGLEGARDVWTIPSASCTKCHTTNSEGRLPQRPFLLCKVNRYR